MTVSREYSSSSLETRADIVMKSVREYYSDPDKIERLKKYIPPAQTGISLRLVDWFVTNYSKKYIIILDSNDGRGFNVYQQYKLMLKGYQKVFSDPFCRKNKCDFYYGTGPDDFIETSPGQLCFFRWVFDNNLVEYIESHYDIIYADMKENSNGASHNTAVSECSTVSKSMKKYKGKYKIVLEDS